MSSQRSCRLALVCVAVLSAYGCDTNEDGRSQVTVVGPSHVGASFVNRADSVTAPEWIQPLFVSGAVCPGIPPFLAPLSLVFHGDGRPGLSLSQVRMEFVDRRGLLGASQIIPRFQLIDRFGSTALPAFGTREFGFSFPFGCVGAPTGTLVIVLVVDDASGHERSRTVRVRVG